MRRKRRCVVGPVVEIVGHVLLKNVGRVLRKNVGHIQENHILLIIIHLVAIHPAIVHHPIAKSLFKIVKK
jgi:hypothetical protein